MLEFYSRHFDTVELNNTFYRLPLETGLEQWRSTSPEGFRFAVKGSRYLTHMKKLKDPEQAISRFFERVDLLGPKLGPVVFQLPPFLEIEAMRLDNFLEALPPHRRYAFEFRNPSWHSDTIYAILQKHNAAFCIFELAGFVSPHTVTADLVYVRLHGPGGAYQGSYSRAAMEQWAARILKWKSQGRHVNVYFDNDQAAFAVQNALTLKSLVA